MAINRLSRPAAVGGSLAAFLRTCFHEVPDARGRRHDAFIGAMSGIRQIAFMLVGLLGGSGCGVITEMVVYPQTQSVGSAPADLRARSVVIPSAAGAPLAAWWMGATPGAPTVVLLHGVTDSRRRMVPRARLLRDAGFAVLLVDGRGHGESPNDIVTYGWRERLDAEAAVAFVRRAQPRGRVGVVGVSLGGPANRLLRPSLEARLGAPLDEIAPLDGVARLGAPVLVAGGAADPFTPPAETLALFEAAHEPRVLWIADGAGHVDLFHHDPEAYRQRVVGFLTAHLHVSG